MHGRVVAKLLELLQARAMRCGHSFKAMKLYPELRSIEHVAPALVLGPVVDLRLCVGVVMMG